MKLKGIKSKTFNRILIACLSLHIGSVNSIAALADVVPIKREMSTLEEIILDRKDKIGLVTPSDADKPEISTPSDADKPEIATPSDADFPEDLELDLDENSRTVHTVETMLWKRGLNYPTFANSYYRQDVTAKCGDTIRFIVHEYTSADNTGDTSMNDNNYYIEARYIYNGKSGADWKNLSEVNGKAPGSASVLVSDSTAGTWYAGYTYQADTADGSERGTRKCGIIVINVSGHNYDYNVTTVTPATCTTDGLRKKTCACGKSEEETIPALGHQVPADYNTSANNGTHFKDCERCGVRLETKQNPYTIKFNGNLGTGTIAEMNMTYGTAKNLPTSGFSRTGYTLKGFNSQADGNGTGYTLGQNVKDLTPVYNGNVTLYAMWEANPYTAVFDGNGGTGGGSITKGYEQKLGTLPTAEKMGYQFLGWFTEKVGGTQITEDSLMPLNGATYYAHWKIMSYPIVWESHGGSPVESWKRDYETELGTLPETKRTGYIFDGWYTSKEGGEKISEKTTVPLNGATYHAHWKPVSYTITWESCDGSPVESWERDYETELGTLPETKRTGYVFDGWYTSKEGGEKISEKTTVPLNGATYYAHWKPVSYTITWESCDGSPVESWERDYETELGTLPETKRTGYVFDGWYTSKEGGEKISEKTTVPLNGATYYAHWKPVSYTITWESCDGSPVESWERDYETELGTLPETKRTGYVFDGWYTSKEGGEKISEKTTVPLNGATYYAHWKPVSYTITWDSMGGVLDFKWTRPYGTELGELPIPLRYGYEFDGWYTNKYFEIKVTEKDTVPLNGATYYAKWILMDSGESGGDNENGGNGGDNGNNGNGGDNENGGNGGDNGNNGNNGNDINGGNNGNGQGGSSVKPIKPIKPIPDENWNEKPMIPLFPLFPETPVLDLTPKEEVVSTVPNNQTNVFPDMDEREAPENSDKNIGKNTDKMSGETKKEKTEKDNFKDNSENNILEQKEDELQELGTEEHSFFDKLGHIVKWVAAILFGIAFIVLWFWLFWILLIFWKRKKEDKEKRE